MPIEANRIEYHKFQAILVKLEPDHRKDKKGYQDDLHDQPTKLRRTSAGKKHRK